MQQTAIYLQENFIFLCTFVILTWADDKNCLENVLKFDGFLLSCKSCFYHWSRVHYAALFLLSQKKHCTVQCSASIVTVQHMFGPVKFEPSAIFPRAGKSAW